MPFPNFHAGRQTDPKKYEKIRYAKDKGGLGIDFIYGIKEDGKSEIQSIRFDKKKFSKADAQAWLKKHKKKTTVENIMDKNSIIEDILTASKSFKEVLLGEDISDIKNTRQFSDRESAEKFSAEHPGSRIMPSGSSGWKVVYSEVSAKEAAPVVKQESKTSISNILAEEFKVDEEDEEKEDEELVGTEPSVEVETDSAEHEASETPNEEHEEHETPEEEKAEHQDEFPEHPAELAVSTVAMEPVVDPSISPLSLETPVASSTPFDLERDFETVVGIEAAELEEVVDKEHFYFIELKSENESVSREYNKFKLTNPIETIQKIIETLERYKLENRIASFEIIDQPTPEMEYPDYFDKDYIILRVFI